MGFNCIFPLIPTPRWSVNTKASTGQTLKWFFPLSTLWLTSWVIRLTRLCRLTWRLTSIWATLEWRCDIRCCCLSRPAEAACYNPARVCATVTKHSCKRVFSLSWSALKHTGRDLLYKITKQRLILFSNKLLRTKVIGNAIHFPLVQSPDNQIHTASLLLVLCFVRLRTQTGKGFEHGGELQTRWVILISIYETFFLLLLHAKCF